MTTRNVCVCYHVFPEGTQSATENQVSLDCRGHLSPTGEAPGPYRCHSGCLLQGRRMCVPEGVPGACVCLSTSPLWPSPSPLSMSTHRLPPPRLHPILAPRLSVSCSPSSWPALGEGQIFTALRLTQDRTGVQKGWCEPASPPNGGQALSTSRRRAWGEGSSRSFSHLPLIIWTSCGVLSDAYL